MKMKSYFKDRLVSCLLFVIFVFILILMLSVFRVKLQLIIGILTITFLFAGAQFLYDYYRKKSFYEELLHNLEQLDQKYLIIETLKKPTFYEGEILVNSLYEINKSMMERIKSYEQNNLEFKEYVEMWIHEVKLPLSALTLMVHNHKGPETAPLLEQIKRLDNYLEQILYYVRSENAEKDYLITENNLEKIISNVALKNKDILLEKKIDFIVTDSKKKVYTDAKWLEFILNQIMDNSMKYKKEKGSAYIKIAAKEEQDKIVLAIYDNGIGISPSDLPQVFNKTFTGKNGRVGTKSTGMGLYIAKKLCNKLGHKIEITSEEGTCTIVKITFSKSSYYSVIK